MMTTSFPLVSIITPTYNRADFLSETVDSVLSQGYPNLEYIVLDDGSTDDTASLMESYKNKLVYQTHPNMGEANTVNKGLSMVHGDLVSVVSSDDPLLPNAIDTMVRFMCDNPEVGVAYPDWNMIDARGKFIDHIQTYEYSYIDMLRWHHCIPGPGTFFRKDISDQLGGRDSQFRYVSDFDFWLRAGLIAQFSRLPETLATFRIHPASASASQMGHQMAEEHITLVNKVYSLPNIPPEALNYKHEAYSSAYYIAGCVCQGCQLEIRRQYFAKAILYAPLKYLKEYRRTRLIDSILPLSYPFLRSLKAFLSKWKRIIQPRPGNLHD